MSKILPFCDGILQKLGMNSVEVKICHRMAVTHSSSTVDILRVLRKPVSIMKTNLEA